MSQNNMELSQWEDGTTRLAYWDSENGKDQLFTLLGGTVIAELYISVSDDEPTITAMSSTEFVDALWKLAKDFSKE